jgi:hypothetical protein
MIDYAKLDPATDDLESNAPYDLVLLYSIATSLARITKKLDGDVLTQPVNAYGESFTDAIQNGLVRGQRGIGTPGTYE